MFEANSSLPTKPAPVMDLSKIDFEALRSRFKASKHKNTDLEVLKAAIRAQLEKLIRLNKTRADLAEKFEELLKLSRNLSDEQQRHVCENMSKEGLVIFDILTRPAPELNAEERAEVKKVARELLNRLKQLLVLNWRQKSAARSQLKVAIEDLLDKLPDAYDRPLYAQKGFTLFRVCLRDLSRARRGRVCCGRLLCCSCDKIRKVKVKLADANECANQRMMMTKFCHLDGTSMSARPRHREDS